MNVAHLGIRRIGTLHQPLCMQKGGAGSLTFPLSLIYPRGADSNSPNSNFVASPVGGASLYCAATRLPGFRRQASNLSFTHCSVSGESSSTPGSTTTVTVTNTFPYGYLAGGAHLHQPPLLPNRYRRAFPFQRPWCWGCEWGDTYPVTCPQGKKAPSPQQAWPLWSSPRPAPLAVLRASARPPSRQPLLHVRRATPLLRSSAEGDA